ncbi:MAG TPA: hypothetical protein VH120_13275 [Gemmataceae bacterium]|nr:hypothetical protein [Gemmataceae bacterium]
MGPDQWAEMRARCEAASGIAETFAPHQSCDCVDCRFGRNARLDLSAALAALAAADRRIEELVSLVHKLADRVHSQSEKLSRRAEKPAG